ncbi:transcription initiation factor tfiid subunit 12 [Anaeramoeba flamelloides]|uniref:Transcription initiation factor tfiid subunit n=1 Tax=Anaeramoeba flamelloides TaxID=1746091 RepID=A0AAV7YLR3_9EUKA|nr:transcription initiation factor tfiid subunit [Anaeramoeba flamelloides]KAJ6248895.1 transcription initiation factor tfiid subunit 12 [Anaeramoeba flamelloides]
MNRSETFRRIQNNPSSLSKQSIQSLTMKIDPFIKIDPKVEEILLKIADEFILNVTNSSCELAKHRGSDTLEVKDINLHLEQDCGMKIPGFESTTKELLKQPSSVHQGKINQVDRTKYETFQKQNQK